MSRPSGGKTTAAILRQICGITDSEMAKILDRSVYTVHSLESGPGRLKLSKELAGRMSRETGIDPGWLLAKDTKAKPIAFDGKPYTKEIFRRVQANKISYDRPHEYFRNLIATGFCARLIAIMEGSDDFHICAYEVHKKLELLRHEFGQDQKLYPIVDRIRPPLYGTRYEDAMPLLEKLVEQGKNTKLAETELDKFEAARRLTHQQSKQPSKKRRH